MWTSILQSFVSTLLFTGLTSAGAVPRALASCNTPSNRACWVTGYNISTDYEKSTPPGGVTRPYTLTITEVDNYVGGDGQVKAKAMLVNGQFPGPVLTADWGDTLQITVVNELELNGTSIHWHGIRQLNNDINDGANGITECPIPPKSSKTYTFLAQQYGTSWYHSHTGVQYANGVTGSILIHGPASLPYDIDLGVFPISDWYYGAADTLAEQIAHGTGAPPPSDNVLFNGSNINPKGAGGQYAKVTLTPGKRHLLRLINPSVENSFSVSLVNHSMTVIATDFVPVDSFTTNSIFMGIGQRYDVTIDASQAVDNYWFNVTYTASGACGSSNNPSPAAIFSYVGAPNALPTSTGTAPPDAACADIVGFTPVVTRTASLSQFTPAPDNLNVTFNGADDPTVFWNVNGNSMQVEWGKPTLEYVREGNTSYPIRENIVSVTAANVWSVWVITNLTPIPHPMHLHGHDFLVLGVSPPQSQPFGAAQRTFSSSDVSSLQLNNPRRRDVTMLPSNGWVVLAFETDNPGAWLFHCHIAWHVSSGLSVQYLERVQDIPGAMNLAAIEPNCNAWNAYYPTDPDKQYDSGI
ncbi:ascomycete fungal laccase from thielavia arenaria [Mollisia scopiformis]|uniref:laccase n=1 Tax=Mollisia scopiformis TaxID=149040 RepID=A0A194WZJ4_MOLSC|nr:ascomycete fungal laccase from thielavia arenaria [Mollisia scopiformis]KUJ13129.1 ascomycete fungal laccase from thielavia arenaria [Mollisia scopiformis]